MMGKITQRLGTKRGICSKGCDRALEFSIITQKEYRYPEMVQKLSYVAWRVLRWNNNY